MTASWDASAAATGAASATMTVSLTCANQPNRVLVAFIMWWSNAFQDTGVKYGGDSLTFLGRAAVSATNLIAVYAMLAPKTGANNLVSTMSNTCVHAIHGTNFYTAKQALPIVTAAGALGSAPNQTVTTAANEMLVDGLASANEEGGANGADQTQRSHVDNVGKSLQSTQPGSAGGVMSWNNASVAWTQYVARILAVSGGDQVIWMFSKLLDDLRRGLVPPQELRRRYQSATGRQQAWAI